MKISYNAAAMRASNALNASDAKVSKSLGRLSSGLKVTTSKDNPSGYAIGKRMNTQITGIGTATQSSNNGISIIETADGALTEVHEMLQRMNELAVKGETGTLTTGDRMTLEQEVKQLKEEITRISTDTQFNGQTLLDGTFDLRGYTNNHKVKMDYYSDEVIPKKYAIEELTVVFGMDGKIDKDATQANLTLRSNGDDAFPAGVKISETTKNKITLKGPLDFEMTLEVEPPSAFPGTVTLSDKPTVTVPTGFNVAYTYTANATATGWNLPPALDEATTISNFTSALQAAAASPGGNTTGIPEDAKITSISDDGTGKYTMVIENGRGFKMELVSDSTNTTNVPTPTYPSATMPQGQSTDGSLGGTQVTAENSLILDATGIGTMDIQTGANEGQQLAVRIPTMSLNRMGIEDVKMTTIEESAEANKAIKGAILYVSDARSRLGAYQNRLEHTVNNLAVSNENMTASYSRIMDVDMAEEMTNYTTEQVISQAAISMLAQANERPSQVLQLLQ